MQLIKTGSVLLLLPLSSVMGFPLYRDTAVGRAATLQLYSFVIEVWFGANARNTSIPTGVLSFQVVFVNKFNPMEVIFLLLFWPVSEGLDFIHSRFMGYYVMSNSISCPWIDAMFLSSGCLAWQHFPGLATWSSPRLQPNLGKHIYQGLSKHQEVGFIPVTKVKNIIVIFWDLFCAI